MAKKISRSDVIGQQGVNYVAGVVLQMECVWQPTGLDAGIDGLIELRMPNGEMTNLVLLVQSKATAGAFQCETETSFTYACRQKDLDYWLGGNAPVLLIVSRPKTNEAYWIDVKSYFADPVARKARRVTFDKTRDAFTAECRDALFRVAAPRSRGIYLPRPGPSDQSGSETLITNLLAVAEHGRTIHSAPTPHRKAKQVWDELRRLRGLRSDWVLHEGRLYSFSNLTRRPLSGVCRRRGVTSMPSVTWAGSTCPDERRLFVRLLKAGLREMTHRELRGFKPENRPPYLYVRPTADRRRLIWRYPGLQQRASRAAFARYGDDDRPYYRHLAFIPRFVCLGADWHLEISPTYHFTTDGQTPHPFSDVLRSGAKRLEHVDAVRGQVLAWAFVLRGEGPGLFVKPYPFLRFGALARVDVPFRFDDQTWGGSVAAQEDPHVEPEPRLFA